MNRRDLLAAFALALRNVMPYALWLLYDDRSIVAYTRLDVDGVLSSETEIREYIAQTTKGRKSIVFLYENGHLRDG